MDFSKGRCGEKKGTGAWDPDWEILVSKGQLLEVVFSPEQGHIGEWYLGNCQRWAEDLI